MSSSQQHDGELWVQMQLRRLGLRRNALRRRTDRLESVLLLGTIVLGLLAVPAAAAVGNAVDHKSQQAAARYRAELRQVQARTLEDAADVYTAVPGQVESRVLVGWLDQAGFSQEGRTYVSVGTKTGAEVTIWLDRSGAVARPPKQAGESAALGVAAGMGVAVASWLILTGAFWLGRVPLDRRRAKDWDREWELVAERWNRRLR